MSSRKSTWFAVFTKPRQERVAFSNLQRQGFECFLPLAANPFQRRRRTSRVPHEPLFPRYLFLNARPEVQNLATVRSTRGVVGLVRSGAHLVTCPNAVIHSLQSRQDPESGLIALPPVVLSVGDAVRVFDGPLAGLCGVLKERCSATRSLLMLKLLGRETTVEVDSLQLQRAG